MERLTYDFEIGGNHCWQVKEADNLECREVCERQGDDGCKTCPIAKAFDRLAAIEDILGDEYDLELVQKLIQAYKEGRYIIMKEPEQAGVSRLRELAQADREGRCVVLPCKIGQKVYDITSGEVIEKSVVSIPFLLSKSINHLCLHAINQRDAITEIGTQDFRKTVFFTRAEAEAALRREQDGNTE